MNTETTIVLLILAILATIAGGFFSIWVRGHIEDINAQIDALRESQEQKPTNIITLRQSVHCRFTGSFDDCQAMRDRLIAKFPAMGTIITVPARNGSGTAELTWEMPMDL